MWKLAGRGLEVDIYQGEAKDPGLQFPLLRALFWIAGFYDAPRTDALIVGPTSTGKTYLGRSRRLFFP